MEGSSNYFPSHHHFSARRERGVSKTIPIYQKGAFLPKGDVPLQSSSPYLDVQAVSQL